MADPNDALLGFWKNRRVFVTGSSGFIGSNLLAELLDRSALPMGYDLVSSSPSLRVLGVDCAQVAGDVLDFYDLTLWVRDFRPEVVFHLTGFSHIAASQETPYEAFRANAMGTVAVLEAVRREAPHAAVVCASSNTVYVSGTKGSQSRYNEYDDLDAVDVYGSSKIAADVAVRCYRESYNLRAAAVRHVNAYGPADSWRSHLVTGAIVACLEGKRPVLRSDGSAMKGYLHCADVVSAYLTVAERIDDLPCHAVNVSDPDAEASAEAVARLVMCAAGMDGDPEILGEDLSQSGYEERLDSALVRGLGWVPQHGLAEGIAATYRWYRERGGLAWLA